MYFLLLFVCYVVMYILGILWFQLFTGKKLKLHISLFDIALITGSFFVILILLTYIPHVELANRVQHAIWGWFMVTLIAFLSYHASKVELSKFVLFHLFFLLATAFWVFNELLESIFQLQFWLIFSQSLPDTWYDLWANSLWALFWAGIFSWFGKNKSSR